MKLHTLFPAAALVIGGWLLVAHQTAQAEPAAPVLEPTTHAPYDPMAIDRTIAFHQTRVETDPQGPLGWAMLAEAWLARSRESDLDTAAWESETAARHSLQLRQVGNPRAQKALVESLLEQHRFTDALATMRSMSIRSPMVADALIEVGRYDDALRVLDEQPVPDDPAVLAVRSRLALASGNPDGALHLLESARNTLAANPGVSSTALAWYEVKSGDALVAVGKARDARARYLAALDLYPASYKAALGLARLSASQGKWDQAAAYASKALETANSLDAKAILGDAATARGDHPSADRWYSECHAMFLAEEAEFGRLGKGGPLAVRPIDRQFASFSSTRGLYPIDGLRAAQRDHQNRPDETARENLKVLGG